MKPIFILPQTKLSTVVSYRNGVKSETLIQTPRSNADLFHTMLISHRIGFSEIRAVKAVKTADMFRGR